MELHDIILDADFGQGLLGLFRLIQQVTDVGLCFGAVRHTLDVKAVRAVEGRPGARGGLLERGPVATRIGAAGPALLHVSLQEGTDENGVGELGRESAKDGRLDAVDPHLAAVAAAVALLPDGAAAPDGCPATLRDDDAASATAAAQEARKGPHGRREGTTRLARRMAEALRAFAPLRGLEDGRRDDREMRHGHALPFRLWVHPAHAPARVGVENHRQAVPDEGAAIERIDENAAAPLGLAVNRGGIPAAPTGRRHAFGVEHPGDRAGGHAFDVKVEDPSDDLRLLLLDGKLARAARHGTIAVGAPAGAAAVPDHAGETAPDLGLMALHPDLAQEAVNPDLEDVGRATVDCADLHAVEPQALVDTRKIALVAADAVERLDYDHIELTGLRVTHEVHQAVAPDERRRGARTVVVGVHDDQSFALCCDAAESELVFDGAVGLEVSRVAGVESGTAGWDQVGHNVLR